MRAKKEPAGAYSIAAAPVKVVVELTVEWLDVAVEVLKVEEVIGAVELEPGVVIGTPEEDGVETFFFWRLNERHPEGAFSG